MIGRKYMKSKKKEVKNFLNLYVGLLLLIAVFPAVGCEETLRSGSIEPAAKNENKTVDPAGQKEKRIPDPELEKNKLLWKQSNISDYKFVSSRLQGGVSGWVPVLIEVKSGKAVSMKPAQKPAELERTDGYEDFDTVEKMFAEIQKHIDNGDNVRITYNKEFGYPERITIVPKAGPVDSQFTIEITKFKRISD